MSVSRRAFLCAALLVIAAACSGSSKSGGGTASSSTTSGTTTTSAATGRPCGTSSTAPSRYDHVIWIWMENHYATDVIGNADAPYETALVHGCGTTASYASVGSPSLPNYIGATSGDIQGIHDDNPPSAHPVSADNLFRQVRAAGLSEKSYEESMPATCALEPSGQYAVKHNPAAYYTGPGDRAACSADDVPLGAVESGALRHDLDANTVPAFSFVTPNLCNDTHDCPVQTGDRWLAQWVPVILASPAYRSGHTALFLVWDEPTPMPFVVISPTTRPGTVAPGQANHYALLRTTEELLGIGSFLGRAATAPSLRAPFGL